MSSHNDQAELRERMVRIETEVDILKKITFGAVGVILLAVLTAAVTLVLRKP